MIQAGHIMGLELVRGLPNLKLELGIHLLGVWLLFWGECRIIGEKLRLPPMREF